LRLNVEAVKESLFGSQPRLRIKLFPWCQERNRHHRRRWTHEDHIYNRQGHRQANHLKQSDGVHQVIR